MPAQLGVDGFGSYRNPHVSIRLCEARCRVVAVNEPFVSLDHNINVYENDSVHRRSDGNFAMSEGEFFAVIRERPTALDESPRFDIHVSIRSVQGFSCWVQYELSDSNYASLKLMNTHRVPFSWTCLES